MDEEDKVCVHCLAGLGKTATLICLYLNRQHNFTAREAIAWMRLVRPGSVSGKQQQFVVSMEGKLNTDQFNELIDGDSKQRKFNDTRSHSMQHNDSGYQKFQVESPSL